MKESVNQHSSVVIIQNGDQPEFMFQEYDSTYPRVPFRNSVHIIGGNYQPSKPENKVFADRSPWDLLVREVREEFSIHEEDPSKGIESHLVSIIGEGPGAQRVGEFAPASDILAVRNQVIDNSRPFADYVYTVPVIGGKTGFRGVVSVYASSIHSDLFETVRDHIAKGKAIRNEGLTRLATGQDILNGTVPSAWWTRDVIGNFLGEDSKNVHGIIIEKIGTPSIDFGSVGKWDDYLNRFDYKVKID